MYNFIYKLKNISYNFLIHTIISHPLHIDAHSEWVFATHFALRKTHIRSLALCASEGFYFSDFPSPYVTPTSRTGYVYQRGLQRGVMRTSPSCNWGIDHHYPPEGIYRHICGLSSWLYNKFSGMNNGKPDDFSEEDRQTLKFALLDISKKLTDIAEKL